MNILLGFSCIIAITLIILYAVFKRPESISFLDRNYTEILKGYAILLVLWSHVGSYLGVNGIEFPSGVGVSIFLILSGYGIEKSFKKHGLKYYWKKRIIRVWLPFAISDIVFLIIEQRKVPFLKILMNYTFIQEIYPFIWYFRFVFVCYFIFWLCAKMFQDQRRRVAMMFAICSLWFIVRSTIFIDETPFLEPRQMFCFPIGILLARGGVTSKKRVQYSLLAICSSVIIYGAIHLPSLGYEHISVIMYNILSVFTCMLCALGFIFLIDRAPLLQNNGLVYIGNISFEIYVIHRYFINRFGAEQSWIGLGKLMVFSMMGAISLHLATELIRKTALNLNA